MVETIKKHMETGELGLVVCKKKLFDEANVPTGASMDPRFKDPKNYMEGFNWDIEAAKLCATYFGAGIGCNDWNKAHVVFLFDEHFSPSTWL